MAFAEAKTRLALNHILVATDFSEASRTAMAFAAALARRHHSELFVANVVEETPITSVPMDYLPPEIEREKGLAKRRMDEFLKTSPLRDLKSEVLIESGFIWPVLEKVVEERKVDLIVLGTHGRGAVWRLMFGSVAEDICRHSSCPVITLGPKVKLPSVENGHLGKILFATDFSEGSLHGLQYALALAEEQDARLTLLHVIHPPSLPTNLTDWMIAESDKMLRLLIDADKMPAKRPIFVTLVGIPADQILAIAARENADLIVMGLHKATGAATHWPFEVFSHVVARAVCPVLSVLA